MRLTTDLTFECNFSVVFLFPDPKETPVLINIIVPINAFCQRIVSPGGRKMSVSPNPNTIIKINRADEEADCSVCEQQGSSQLCNPKHLTLEGSTNTSVEFTCPQPQDAFTVEINREIGTLITDFLTSENLEIGLFQLKLKSSVHVPDCKETPCSGEIVRPESSIFPNFNRTFIWDLRVNPTQAFQLDLPEGGMRQIPNGETCPDEHTYSLVTYLRTGPATIGTFCTGGTITTILVLYKALMSLQVPGHRKLDPVDFTLSNGPETSSKFPLVATGSWMESIFLYFFNHSVILECVYLHLLSCSRGNDESQSAAWGVQHRFHHRQLSQRFPGQAAGGVGLRRARHAQLHGALSGPHGSRVPPQGGGGGVPPKGQAGDQAGSDGPTTGAPTGQLQNGAEELRNQHHAAGTRAELQRVCNEERSSRYAAKSEGICTFLKKRSRLRVVL